MDATARLSLPFILPGQAQKEYCHNEALQTLDVLVQGVVEGPPVNDPPTGSTIGATYLVGATPTGDWAEQANSIAAWTVGGWRFVKPSEGFSILIRATSEMARFTQGAWNIGIFTVRSLKVDGSQVVGRRQPAIADVSGGSVQDSQSRAALGAILGALRTHGLIAS